MCNAALISKIEAEIGIYDGLLEWVTDYGIGVSFPHGAIGDPEIADLPLTVRNAVWLDLTGALITDESCKELATARKLESLNISRTNLSFNGLKRLNRVASLVELRLTEDMLNEDDLHILSTLLPDVRITTCG
jgi:hypothetical protein